MEKTIWVAILDSQQWTYILRVFASLDVLQLKLQRGKPIRMQWGTCTLSCRAKVLNRGDITANALVLSNFHMLYRKMMKTSNILGPLVQACMILFRSNTFCQPQPLAIRLNGHFQWIQVTTKVWWSELGYDKTRQSVSESLQRPEEGKINYYMCSILLAMSPIGVDTIGWLVELSGWQTLPIRSCYIGLADGSRAMLIVTFLKQCLLWFIMYQWIRKAFLLVQTGLNACLTGNRKLREESWKALTHLQQDLMCIYLAASLFESFWQMREEYGGFNLRPQTSWIFDGLQVYKPENL